MSTTIEANGSTVTVSIEGATRALVRWVAETVARIVGGARVTGARIVGRVRAVVSIVVDGTRVGVAAVAAFEVAESIGLVETAEDAERSRVEAFAEITVAAWIGHIADSRHPNHAANSFARHRHEFGVAYAACEAATLRRMMIAGMAEHEARNLLCARMLAFDIKLHASLELDALPANDNEAGVATTG